MRPHHSRCLPVATLLFVAALMLGSPSTSHAAAMSSDPNCAQHVLPRNDDDGVHALLGFSVRLGDQVFTEVVVDNNGYVLFGAEPPAAVDYDLLRLDKTALTIIAPFLADVDTRKPDSGQVTYGQTTYDGRPAFCVNWGSISGNGVDYYESTDTQRNKFQLILVDRGNRGTYDFDIVLNYDQVQWDFAYDLTQHASPVLVPTWVGFKPGIAAALPGSGELPGELLDGQAHALTAGSRNSPQAGRYIFEINNGLPPDVATVSGTFYDPDGNPLAGGTAQVCRSDGTCFFAHTDTMGHYSVFIPNGELDGNPFTLSGSAPDPLWLFPAAPISMMPVAGNAVSGMDVHLTRSQPPPSGVAISPAPVLTPEGIPVINWRSAFTLSAEATCSVDAPLSVTYRIFRGGDTTAASIRSGPMPRQGTTNTYAANIAALFPEHGPITVTITTSCRNQPSHTTAFNIYIDPSGTVRNANGNRILHARVTLYRSDNALGPFEVVPDGSTIMSPANRVNPMFSDDSGHFGWDTLAGYYVVRAEKPGCTAVGRAELPYAETDVLPVPPPVTDLELRLDCSAVPPPAISAPSSLAVEAQAADGALVNYEASALDAADGPVALSCVPASGSWLSMGTTVVTCSAMNSYGNVATRGFPVTVADTLPPVLTLPDAIAVHATSAAGASVTYQASAVDSLDGSVQPVCSPSSGSLFPPGETRVLCHATDAHGNTAQGSFPVQVAFEFGGVLPPLAQGEAPVFKRHQPIPVRFALAGASARISDLSARLFVAKVEGAVVGLEVPAVSTGGGFSGNLFRSEGPHGVYHFLMATAALDAGVYRLRIDLGDGTLHTVLVTIRN